MENDDVMYYKCVNELLSRTFIIKGEEKDKNMYDWMTASGNMARVRKALETVGWTVAPPRYGVIMKEPSERLKEVTCDQTPYSTEYCKVDKILQLILCSIYYECWGSGQADVITMGELVDRLEELPVTQYQSSQVKNSLKVLRKHKLVDFRENDFKLGREMKIRIYPSVTMCQDDVTLKKIIKTGLENAAVDMDGQENGTEPEGGTD